MTATPAERQAEKRRRKREGLVHVDVWVPQDVEDRIARLLRDMFYEMVERTVAENEKRTP